MALAVFVPGLAAQKHAPKTPPTNAAIHLVSLVVALLASGLVRIEG
jgi:hypothetical protein